MKKRSNTLILLSIFIIAVLPSVVLPYILPSSQIVEMMTDKFASIKTLQVTQHTTIKDIYREKTFEEIVSLRSPYFCRSETPGQPGNRLIIRNEIETLRIIDRKIAYEGKSYDFFYRFLLLAHDSGLLLERLKEIGVDTDKASLTRFGGKIAYLIGEKEEGTNRLIVDKELFLPLLLEYGDYRFRFSDYIEFMEHAWYPSKILYSYKGRITEEYAVMDIKANLPIDASLFDIPKIRAKFSNSELKWKEE